MPGRSARGSGTRTRRPDYGGRKLNINDYPIAKARGLVVQHCPSEEMCTCCDGDIPANDPAMLFMSCSIVVGTLCLTCVEKYIDQDELIESALREWAPMGLPQ